MQQNAPLKRLIYWLVAGTRGGGSRGRIIESLKEMPKNANMLADSLGMEYKNVRHHLDVLLKNGLLTTVGEGYGMTYFLSSELESNYQVFEEIWEKIGKMNKKRDWRKKY
ncbi:MAG: winged helix-turn-helix transcriptional regulator [Candidatus Methanosuratus sp.]|nr:winged helix-turn-helix transcriptional regulator [Candidatus Methanosuratincola sp.]